MIKEGASAAERNVALRAGFAEIPPNCRQQLATFISDTLHACAQISLILQIPAGSVGGAGGAGSASRDHGVQAAYPPGSC
jgi:hypothetical protein